MVKKNAIYNDKTQHANLQDKPLFEALKHLSNDEK